MRTINCVICGEKVTSRGNYVKYCLKCKAIRGKEIKKKYSRAWYLKNRDKILRQKNWRKHRGEYSERIKQYNKVYRQKNGDKLNLEQRTKYKLDLNFRLKDLARATFKRALKKGLIEKGTICSKCGSNKNIEAHHPDYSKPYEVVWLCASHHKELHSEAKCLSILEGKT